MAIPLDSEDILGAGCLASIGRALSALACLWLGAATGILGFESGALAAEVIQGGTVNIPEIAQGAFLACLWGPLVMVGSIFILSFSPLLLAAVFTLVRSENRTLKNWVAYCRHHRVAHHAERPLMGGSQFAVHRAGSGDGAGVCRESRTGAYLMMGLAAESDERRRSLAEEFGPAVADRDYAIGDPSHVPRPP